eukprot:TRINITY_DN1692_c0_g4_i1.p1 TRINITY_DN1692_c0_g4~~TRINITY_DN1692_c0_g4_i1.p1  ORF type:complete len:506 (+),score=102.26 TRINITY_DN1692_c0_g4_i1:90-1607(+)
MARPADRINSALSKHGYAQLKKVGEGSFGAAILVQHTSEKERDTKAICKMIDISRASKAEKDDALKESQVLSSLKHPYIVRYRESFHEDGWLCIVMDYCEGGDLSDRLKKTRQAGKSVPQEQVLRWFTQAILALKYIHDMHILHRDLKSGNFFLSKSGNLKMGDFGIAKVLECTAACAQTQIGTPYYLSPEICQGKPYAWGSDIWSMGCILFEMCARKVPFDAPDLKSLIQKITKGPSPEVPSEYSAPVKALCKELLDRDPAKRPPAAEILKRPVVQDMVRRMLNEVKGDEDKQEDKQAGGSAPSGAGRGSSAQRSGNNGGNAGKYERNAAVEYYSETHGEWLPATITNVDEQGRVMLNVKPGVYLSLEVQAAKVRPRQAPSQGADQRSGSQQRQTPSNGGGGGMSPSRGGRPPQDARRDAPPSSGGGLARNPSRDVLPQDRQQSGMRAASPRRDVPQRAPSQERGASAGAARGDAGVRRSTPQRQSSSPFRPAGMPSARGSSNG